MIEAEFPDIVWEKMARAFLRDVLANFRSVSFFLSNYVISPRSLRLETG
jgi:hypothetical protein